MARKRVQGASALRRRLQAIRRNTFDELAAQIRDESNTTLARSRDLAPQLTGEMIATANVQVEEQRSASLIRAVISYPAPYALYQHEGVYNPGPVTSVKLGPRRGIGRKFLQRAVDERAQPTIVACGRALERALRLTLR